MVCIFNGGAFEFHAHIFVQQKRLIALHRVFHGDKYAGHAPLFLERAFKPNGAALADFAGVAGNGDGGSVFGIAFNPLEAVDGDGCAHMVFIRAGQRGQSILQIDLRSEIGFPVDDERVERRTDFGARQIESSLFELGLGGFELGGPVFHVRYAQGKCAVGFGRPVAGFDQFPFAGGDVALARFKLELELGFGQGGFFLFERQLVVDGIDLQHRLALVEGAAGDEVRCDFDNFTGNACA